MGEKDSDLRAIALLQESFGILAPDSFRENLNRYCALVSTWNEYASLMSSGDVRQQLRSHIADSLSLVPLILAKLDRGCVYVDIGSGNGLPAIPVLLYLSRVPGTLVERNSRKVTFLQRLLVELSLDRVTLIEGSFPDVSIPEGPLVLTSRAMEKPRRFLKDLVLVMSDEDRFLRQVGTQREDLPSDLVENPVQDAFDDAGLRRGTVYEVRRGSQTSRNQ